MQFGVRCGVCHGIQAYYIFDELVVSGEIAETSKKGVFKAVAEQDLMEEVCMCACVSSVLCPCIMLPVS